MACVVLMRPRVWMTAREKQSAMASPNPQRSILIQYDKYRENKLMHSDFRGARSVRNLDWRSMMNRKFLFTGLVLAVLTLGVGATVFRSQTQAQAPAPAAAPGAAKYTVLETDGTNLLVVDNSANTLYFYTLDQGKEVGDDLHLRGSLDLTQVGKPTISPKKVAK